MKEFIENYSRPRLDPMSLDRRIFSSFSHLMKKLRQTMRPAIFFSHSSSGQASSPRPREKLRHRRARLNVGVKRLGHLQLVRNFIS